MPAENTPLVSPEAAAAGTTAAVTLVNASADKVRAAKMDGPLSFRTLGFLGGWAMVFSNGIAILDRFFSFNLSGSLIAAYNVLFGFVIIFLEMPPIFCCRGGRASYGVRYYAKFLEYTWGRGLLFFFCGSLQISNWNMLDWAVGGYMMFVGFVAICAGIGTAKELRLLKFSIKDEADLKAKWQQYDADGNGSLDVKELTKMVNGAGIEMTRHEIAATYLALDKNFDDKISYEEFYAWWSGADAYGADNKITV